MKKAVFILSLLVFSNSILAQDYPTKEELDRAMCTITHLRDALAASEDKFQETQDFNAAYETYQQVITHYNKSENHDYGYMMALGGALMVTQVQTYLLWKSLKFGAVADAAQLQSFTIFFTDLQAAQLQSYFVTMMISMNEAENANLFREMLTSKKQISSEKEFIAFFKKNADTKLWAETFEQNLEHARLYNSDDASIDYWKKYSYEKASKDATEAAEKLDQWMSNPGNKKYAEHLIHEKYGAEFLQNVKQVQQKVSPLLEAAEYYTAKSNKFRWWGNVVRRWGFVIFFAGLAWQTTEYMNDSPSVDDVINMNAADLRHYLSSHFEDVQAINEHADELGCFEADSPR